MWISFEDMRGSPVGGAHASIGGVRDLLFDPRDWRVCELLVDPDVRSTSARVALPQRLTGAASMASVPVAGRRERASAGLETDCATRVSSPRSRPATEPVHSCGAILGAMVRTLDGPRGFVRDFVLVAEDWTIPLLVLELPDSQPGRAIAVEVASVRGLDTTRRTVDVNLSADDIGMRPDSRVSDGRVVLTSTGR